MESESKDCLSLKDEDGRALFRSLGEMLMRGSWEGANVFGEKVCLLRARTAGPCSEVWVR